MTYDEAVKYLISHHWGLTEAQAKGLLDAISFRQMQEQAELWERRAFERQERIEELERGNNEWAKAYERKIDQRDTARALADELKAALDEAGVRLLPKLKAAYEERGWK